MNKIDDIIKNAKTNKLGTLNVLSDLSNSYDEDIKTFIKFFQSIKLNRNVEVNLIKHNMHILESVKLNIDKLQEKLENIYELYTTWLEEEVNKIKYNE